jgi:hypothetical protein
MRYLFRFNENMALAKSIISKKMDAFERLKDLLKNNMGYIGKFTDYLMNENIPFSELEDIYKDLVELKTKQRSIDISSLGYEELIDKIKINKNDLNVNSLISQFPSEQKAIARDLIKSKDGYNLLLKASSSDKLKILLTKISRYHTESELKNALTIFSKESMNEREKIKEFLKTSKSSICYESDDIMIVRVVSLSDIQKLGSDTSWCILRESQWRSYTSDRYQYILYDFQKDEWDPKFKIGFTLNKDYSVYAAHDILDKPCIPYLNELTIPNDIKYSDLVPKSSDIKVTDDMIKNIKKSDRLSLLNKYSDNISLTQIPIFIRRLFDLGITAGKVEILRNCLNKYFSDKQYVTISDLEKIDDRLSKSIKSLLNKDQKILRKKLVLNPTLSTFNLDSDIIIKMLDVWDMSELTNLFVNNFNIEEVIKIPGTYGYLGSEIRISNHWDKDMLVKICDKLNQVYDSGEWEKIESNDFKKNKLITNYVILNYFLDRRELIKKNIINKISDFNRGKYAYILKLPFSADKCSSDINEWNIPFIIKKDYDGEIYIRSFKSSTMLIDHLLGYKLRLKVGKNQIDALVKNMNNNNIPDSQGKKIMIEFFKKLIENKKRIGTVVETDDNKISVSIF